jgi:cleavage and polyadenylation specificity factor subunit 3
MKKFSFSSTKCDDLVLLGIHPGLAGMDALPFVDLIEPDEIDLLFISQ